MKIHIHSTQLKIALRQIVGFAKNSKTLPILSCILINAGESLKMAASDLEHDVSIRIEDAKIERPGSAAVPARMLYRWICQMPAGPITLEASHNLTVSGEKCGQVRFPIYSVEDFPVFESKPFAASFDIDGQVLRELFARAKNFALINDDTHPLLCTVQLWVGNGSVRATATDGLRLMSCTASCDTVPFETISVLVPITSVNHILQHWHLSKGHPVSFRFNSTSLQIASMNTTIRTPWIDGKFPDWRVLKPRNSNFTVAVRKSSLLEMTEQVAFLAKIINASYCAMRLHLSPGCISARYDVNDEGVHYERSIPCAFHGDEFDINFDASLLAGLLRAVPDKDLTLRLTDSSSPVLIMDDGETYDAIIMPMYLG